MRVKVIVVGCSPAWPNPGGAQSGYLVEGDGRLLLDCGPGVLPRLREQEGWPRVDAIVITHFHLDHWGDLVPWTFGAMFGPGHDTPKPDLWLPPGGLVELEQFGQKFGVPGMFSEGFATREYKEGEPFQTCGLTVTPVRVPHYQHILGKKPSCDWFEIISENYMCDGGRPLEVLDQILEQYRVVQHGVSMYFGSTDKLNREHLKRLKTLSMGHHVVMGRKTFDEIGRKPLPGRTNIIISRSPIEAQENVVPVATIDEALAAIPPTEDELFILGGAEIFRQTMHRATRMYITQVHADVPGDTYFPEFDDVNEWRLVDREDFEADAKNDFPYSFLTYDRVAPAIHPIAEEG